ncbi:MAG: glycosyltransferase family A protein [Chloroflexota bacterium]
MDKTFEPTRIIAIDLSDPPEVLETADPTTHNTYDRAFTLVRSHGQVLGVIEFDLPITYEDYMPLIRQRFIIPETPAPTPPPLTVSISVVICTRDRTEDLKKCLPSILEQEGAEYEVIVVDNAPSTEDTRLYVESLSSDRLRYIHEPTPGLSVARNTGLDAATGEIIAFTDDDALASADWLHRLVYVFETDDQVGCVTGLTLPAELESEAQVMFERFGGFNKGRGFEPIVWSMKTHAETEPLFPYLAGQFGAGVNMAYRTELIRDLGKFDDALGAGTPAKGAEDIDMFFRVIVEGYKLVYEPNAVLYHHHRRNYDGLAKQLQGSGKAFGAFVMKCIIDRPSRLLYFLGQVPFTIRYLFGKDSARNENKQDEFPQELANGELLGMAQGPFLYLYSRYRRHNA